MTHEHLHDLTSVRNDVNNIASCVCMCVTVQASLVTMSYVRHVDHNGRRKICVVMVVCKDKQLEHIQKMQLAINRERSRHSNGVEFCTF